MSITIGSSETQNIQIEVSDSQSVQVTDSPTQLISIEAAGRGPTGLAGAGLAAGGEVGQLIAKASTTDYDTEWTSDINVTSIDISSGNAVLSWNDQDGTIDVAYANGVTLQVGQEQHFYAKATEPIDDGDIVMFVGAQGSHSLIAKADMSSPSFFPQAVMGVATQSFVTNEFGYVTSFGKVRGINLSDYDNGDLLYLDPDNAGKFVTTAPTPPNHAILVAAVADNKNNGTMLVRLTHLPDTDEIPEGSTNLYYTDARADARIAAAKLRDIGNVLSTTATSTNSILAYNQGLDLWLPTLNPHLSSINASTATFTTVSVAQQLLFSGGGGNIIGAGIGTDDLLIESNGNVTVLLDKDGDETNQKFIVADSASSNVNETKFSVDENGDAYVAGSLGVGVDTPEETLHVTPSVLVGTKGFASPLSGQLRAASPNTSYGELGFTSQYDNFAAGFRSYGLSSNYNRDLRFYTKDTVSSVDGAERMRITEAGNVGIGTTSPDQKLEVSGSIRQSGASDNILIRNGAEIVASNQLALRANSSYLQFQSPINAIYYQANTGHYFRNGDGSSTHAIITNTGNVGIGTTTPSDRLDVSGNLKLVNTQDYIKFANDLNTIKRDGANAMRFDSYGGFKFHDTSNNAERVRIDASGNVGIGTTTPLNRLQVANGDVYLEDGNLKLDRNNEGRVEFGISGDMWGSSTGNAVTIKKPTSSYSYVFGTQDGQLGLINANDSTDNFYIDRDGFKTYNSASLRFIQHSDIGDNYGELLRFSNSLASNGQHGYVTITGDVSIRDHSTGVSVEKIKLGNDGSAWFNGGNVGIGTTTPSYKLEVSGGDISLPLGNYIRFGGQLGIKKVNNGPMHFYAGTNSTTGGFDFATWNGASYDEGAFVIRNNGNVGIGTTTPLNKLDVVGLANINDGSDNVMISSGNTSLTTGTDNTAVGKNAGSGISTGTKNTAVGKSALGTSAAATNGSNTAVGHSALYQATGGSNVAVGRNAGLKAGASNVAIGAFSLNYTTGDTNVAVGVNALSGDATSTFSGCVAVGYNALNALTTGSSNSAVGYNTLKSTTSGSYNVAFGSNALESNLTGVSNSAFGTEALRYNTGANNTAFGTASLRNKTSGDNNSAFGVNALYNNLTGSNNIAVGRNAGYYTTGSNNALIGYYAGYGDAASNYSNTVAVGHQSLYDLTTGTNNTAIGYQASANTTTGSFNVSLGNYALWKNLSTSANTALGYGAAYETTSGNNTAVGYLSAYYSQEHNTALGVRALNYSTGSYNVAIGSNAAQGVYGVSNYSNTVAVGYQAGTALTTGGSNVLIGYQAGSTLTTESHKLYIENSNSTTPLIYGEFDNDILRVNGTLQVGDPTGTGFALPSTDGTANQVLSTDGAGTVSWVDQSGGAATDAEIGQAYKTTSQTLSTTPAAITSWTTETQDDLSIFDPTTGALTITQAGKYLIAFEADFDMSVFVDRENPFAYIEKDGTEISGSRRHSYQRSVGAGEASVALTMVYEHTTGTAVFKAVVGAEIGVSTTSLVNASMSYSTLGGNQGPQGVSGDAFAVSTEAAGRTLVAGDHLKYLRSTSATAVTFTVPPQSSVSWVDNAEIVFEQAGAGQITIAAGSGVTINSSETLKSGQQYAVIGLKRVASDTWTLTGERELAP